MLELLTVNIKAALNYKLVYEDMNWGSGKEYHFLYHDLTDYTIIKKEIYNYELDGDEGVAIELEDYINNYLDNYGNETYQGDEYDQTLQLVGYKKDNNYYIYKEEL